MDDEMKKFYGLGIILGGILSSIILLYPFNPLNAFELIGVLFASFLWLLLCIAFGTRISKDYDLSRLTAYSISFAISTLGLICLSLLILPDGLTQDGTVLVRQGSLTLAGWAKAFKDAALVSLSVPVHAVVTRFGTELR